MSSRRFLGRPYGRGMKRHPTTLPVVLLGLGAAALGAGCGGSDESSHATATQASRPARGSLNVRLTDYKISPALNVVSAGKVRISAVNAGGEEHEMIVVRTDAKSTDLPIKEGRVDEDGLGSAVMGEISELKPGASGQESFRLEPGTYLLFCNVPGHYKHGMIARLLVR
jgi:uncharacterized cupredoxin-like copper-binding protein